MKPLIGSKFEYVHTIFMGEGYGKEPTQHFAWWVYRSYIQTNDIYKAKMLEEKSTIYLVSCNFGKGLSIKKIKKSFIL